MADQSPPTLRSLAGAPLAPAPLSESALVVIDAQQEYAAGGALELPNLAAALDNIALLETAARSHDALVIHVAHVGKSGGLFDPSTGGRLIDRTGPAPGEHVVSKTLPNSFAGTELGELLSQHAINSLVVVGFMTHMCVSSTARVALDLGYATTVIADATATRPLPRPDRAGVIAADNVHQSSLAALADRFSMVASTAALI